MKGPREQLEGSNPNHPAAVNSLIGISSLTNNNEREVDFSEYEWMWKEMEEFDQKCLEELWEEAFIEAMFEDMLDEEDQIRLLLDDLDPEERVELARELHRLSALEGEDSLIPEIYILDERGEGQPMWEPSMEGDAPFVSLVRSDSTSSLSSLESGDDEAEDR